MQHRDGRAVVGGTWTTGVRKAVRFEQAARTGRLYAARVVHVVTFTSNTEVLVVFLVF